MASPNNPREFQEDLSCADETGADELIAAYRDIHLSRAARVPKGLLVFDRISAYSLAPIAWGGPPLKQ